MFDTSGMLHTCGKRLVYRGMNNGCYVLACPNKKCDASYRIPVEDPEKLVSPCELITLPGEGITGRLWGVSIENPRVYNCRECGMEITEEQALRTYHEEDRALCVKCEGREHGIEIMGFAI